MKTVQELKNYEDTRLICGYLRKRKRGGLTELDSSEVTAVAGKEFLVMEDSEERSIVDLSPSPAEETAPVRILVAESEREEEEEARFACLSHGSISVIGRRRIMEDAVTVAPGLVVGDFDLYDFFAVYDGHGGAKVANACSDRLHSLVAAEMAAGWNCGGGGGRDWEKLMVSCFQKMDEEVNGGGVEVESGGGAVSVRTVGSTAVVVMVGREEIVVANCGDSRAVLCRGGVAVPLSRDHKPDRPDERDRIEAAGGRVLNWNGSRVLGVLATSRSIGDHYLKPFVIPEPEVTVRERTELDNFVIIASDGLWDVVSNEVACEVVRRCLDGQFSRMFPEEWSGSSAAEASAILAELAMARGSRDNISAVVVELSKPG